jgi:hypothetical protein
MRGALITGLSLALALTPILPESVRAEWEYMEFDGDLVWDSAFRPGPRRSVCASGTLQASLSGGFCNCE